MKSSAPSFDGLERAATLIAQHGDYPGRREVIADCLEDIDDRWQRGLLTLEQRFRLYAILVKGSAPQRREQALALAV
jgi:hypothetical protein